MIEDGKISNGMRIGIDARLWAQSGVGRYIRNLVSNLLLLDVKNEYVLFVRSEDETAIKNQISKSKIKNQKSKIVPVNISWHSFAEQIRFPRIINKEKIDLMHFPYFSVPIFYKKPFIVTIHDLVYHHFVSGQASTLPYWFYGFKMLMYRILIYSAARKAKKVIAVSKATKDEIIDHLRIAPSKIEVTYEAADDFSARGGSSFGRKLESDKLDLSNYFLFVGNVYPHKDVDTLIRAFKIVVKDRDVKLVFIGKEDFISKKLKRRLSDMIASKHVIFLEQVDDSALASYYQNAICLVRPSLMEGFSLPPLEAVANKCLVIASDIPVHREIFGDSITYFSPRQYMDLKDKMEYVLSLDEKSKDRMITRGLKKSKEYSWSLTAKQTLRVYNNL